MTRFHALVLAICGFVPAQADEPIASTGAQVVPELPLEAPAEDESLYAAPTTDDRIGRIAAPVMINGRGPFRLILDTGANQSVITRRVADALGLVLTPESRLRLQGVTGTLEVPALRLDSLETGDLVQNDLTVAVLESVMGGADGILGTQGFADMRVTVDFRRDNITIARSRNQRARSYEGTIRATMRFGRLLVVDGHLGRTPVKAVIDTGAQMTLGNMALKQVLLDKRRYDDGEDNTTVVGLDKIGQSGRYMVTRQLTLGEAEINNLGIIFGDIHVFKLWGLEEEPALLVGMDVLGSLERLVIDYRREEIQFRNTLRLR